MRSMTVRSSWTRATWRRAASPDAVHQPGDWREIRPWWTSSSVAVVRMVRHSVRRSKLPVRPIPTFCELTMATDIFVYDLKAAIRSIPDYPKPGIMFRDITTLLGNARAFRRAVDELVQPW